MTKLIAFNKPYQVLCQFTDKDGRANLSDFIPVPGVYVAGRLDRDSEGLLLLTDDGRLQHRISHPRAKCWKSYWVQVEGMASEEALEKLRSGMVLKDGPTLPARARLMSEPPGLWPRNPPVRYRARIPTSWIHMEIREGRNRQIRRMTAAAGLPTLRLVRHGIGGIHLDGLRPGEWRYADSETLFQAGKRTGGKHARRAGA